MPRRPDPESTPSTRDRILDSAAEVMRTVGLARSTTKEIARAANLSEAALYRHFADKTDLFLHVLKERSPSLGALLAALETRAGKGTIEDILREIALEAVLFFEQTIPIGASLFAEPALLSNHRDAVHARGGGPHRPNELLASYLRSEQNEKRLDPKLDTDAVASLLLGACFQRAFLVNFGGKKTSRKEHEKFARGIVETLCRGVRR